MIYRTEIFIGLIKFVLNSEAPTFFIFHAPSSLGVSKGLILFIARVLHNRNIKVPMYLFACSC